MTARALIPPGKKYRLLRRPPESIRPGTPHPTRRDCHGRLIAALIERCGGDCEIAEGVMTPWASATFIGARHALTLVLMGEDASLRAEALAVMLPEANFAIPGHVVADVAVDRVATDAADEARLMLSVLTIEAW